MPITLNSYVEAVTACEVGLRHAPAVARQPLLGWASAQDYIIANSDWPILSMSHR